MTEQNESTAGGQPADQRVRVPEAVPVDLVDYGDAAQRAEMDGVGPGPSAEPVVPVDVPVDEPQS